MARGTADTSLVKQGYSKVAYTPDTLEDFKNCEFYSENFEFKTI